MGFPSEKELKQIRAKLAKKLKVDPSRTADKLMDLAERLHLDFDVNVA
jgi:hypothetical protein